MIRTTLLVLLAVAGVAGAAPKKDDPPAAKDADRHFKAGVGLYNEQKYAEALAEFERAYEIQPHPLVLYNMAACHRELSHYGDAVKFYRRFIKEGQGKVPAAKLKTAQKELDDILARIARVTVNVSSGDDTELIVDGISLGTTPLDSPIILPPGEHKIVARAIGHKDAERTVRVASGDEVEVKLVLAEAPAQVEEKHHIEEDKPSVEKPVVVAAPKAKKLALGAAYGTNLAAVGDTGAPTLGIGFAATDRIEVGVDAVVVAYAVMPSVRVRIAGDAMSVHAALAVPIAFTDGAMSETFVAGAFGLGLRYRVTPALAFRLESFASFAGKTHGTTFPAFLGGELWF